MDTHTDTTARGLEPLDYHMALQQHLQAHEPHVWDKASGGMTAEEIAELRDTMLRNTYRLEESGHPQVFAALNTAMERLGIDAPATLYQANDGTMNASLIYVPGEVHLAFFGPILERLSEPELLALMGHELSHYLLWQLDEGAHHRTSRIFDHALSFAEAKPAHRETARLLSLYTELFADRGAAIAARDTTPAIAVLVKTMTGLTSVDPEAYLRQAEELEAKGGKSQGHSHPEIYLRARALKLWWERDATLADWLEARVQGPLSIEALDLIGQHRLTALTRGFLARMLAEVEEGSDEIVTQVRAVFPDFAHEEEKLDLADLSVEKIDDATRDYFIALMFDLAMADSDATEVVMLAAAKTAASMGATERLSASLRRDLKWTKARADKLLAQAAKAA